MVWNFLSREKQGLTQKESDKGGGCDCVILPTTATLAWSCVVLPEDSCC